MLSTEGKKVEGTSATDRKHVSYVLAARSGLYILLVLAFTVIAGAYGLRKYGIFGCQASGYSADAYLGYCGATSYGDYDHGAIWFDLEPQADAAAATAQVLFIGNSRTQFAFSSSATSDWFSSIPETYYLLGFSHWENYTFEAPLLRKLHPKAKVYVINIDSFFDQAQTGPGKTVMQDDSAKTNYEEKRKWQSIHKTICTAVGAVCGNDWAIFRARSTGAWLVTGGEFAGAPVTYDDSIDQNKVASYTARAQGFLSRLPVSRQCTIFTIVPTVGTSIGTGRAIANNLGFELIAPRLSGLLTFDQYHLDRRSAQRWSAAFLEEAGPQIRNCVGEATEKSYARATNESVP